MSLPVHHCERMWPVSPLKCDVRPRNRQPSSAFGTVRRLNTSSVSAYYGFHKRKSQPTAFRVSSFDSALEDVGDNFRSKSRAIVLHGQVGGVLTRSKVYRHGTR